MSDDDLWPSREDVSEITEEGRGFWKSCSGCHELNEGYPTGPMHPILRCAVGVGCFECGGIGAVWDTTDYGAMGDALANPAADARAEALKEAAVVAAEHMAMHNGKDMNSFRACIGVHDAILALIGGAE